MGKKDRRKRNGRRKSRRRNVGRQNGRDDSSKTPAEEEKSSLEGISGEVEASDAETVEIENNSPADQIGTPRLSETENNGSSDGNATDHENPNISHCPDIDSLGFMKLYTGLIKDAKRLGINFGDAEDIKERSVRVVENVRGGEKLASKIGPDTSKARIALTHTAALAEAAKRNVEKCGNSSSLFSVDEYLEVLKNLSLDEEGEFCKERAGRVLEPIARCCCEGLSLISLEGIIEFEKDVSVVNKVRRPGRCSKSAFDDTLPPTQHEVVKGSKKKTSSGRDPLLHSQRQAEELQKFCTRSKKPAVGILEYGRRGAGGAQDLIQKVLDASVMTRDGYAELLVPAAVDSQRLSPESLLLRAAKPPDPDSFTEDRFNLNRTQYVLSLNAKDVKALFRFPNRDSSSRNKK